MSISADEVVRVLGFIGFLCVASGVLFAFVEGFFAMRLQNSAINIGPIAVQKSESVIGEWGGSESRALQNSLCVRYRLADARTCLFVPLLPSPWQVAGLKGILTRSGDNWQLEGRLYVSLCLVYIGSVLAILGALFVMFQLLIGVSLLLALVIPLGLAMLFAFVLRASFRWRKKEFFSAYDALKHRLLSGADLSESLRSE